MPPRKKPRLAGLEADATALSTHQTPNAVKPGGLSRVRRRKGCLEYLQHLPLELCMEIFGHLHPKDCLNLARASKIFRSFLLKPDMASVWQASLSTVEDLPECPSWLSEPAYAHLLFGSWCQNCARPSVHNAIWPWYARYCAACIPTVSYGLDEFDTRKWGFDSSVDTPTMHHFNLCVAPVRKRRIISHRFHKTQIARLLTEWAATADNAEARRMLLNRQEQEVEKRTEHATRCTEWCRNRENDRAIELDDIRRRRMEDIVKRLTVEGWSEEVNHFGMKYIMQRLEDIPAARQPSKLTNRGWPRVIAAVKEELVELRDRRLKDERVAIIESRLHTLSVAIFAHYGVQVPRTPEMDCKPDYTQVMHERECHALLVAPNEREVTSADFAEVIPDVCARWVAKCEQRLIDEIRKWDPAIADGPNPLALAITAFSCRSCYGSLSGPFRYPGILAHVCNRHTVPGWETRLRHAKARRLAGERGYLLQHDNDKPTYAIVPCRHENAQYMWHVVAALGLDPARATFEDLQTTEGRLRCKVCFPADREIFAWDAALHHRHSGCHDNMDFWERVSNEDLAKVQELEAEMPKFSVKEAKWGCSLCLSWNALGSTMETHLRTTHGIEDLEKSIKDGIVYLHVDQHHTRRAPVKLPVAASE